MKRRDFLRGAAAGGAVGAAGLAGLFAKAAEELPPIQAEGPSAVAGHRANFYIDDIPLMVLSVEGPRQYSQTVDVTRIDMADAARIPGLADYGDIEVSAALEPETAEAVQELMARGGAHQCRLLVHDSEIKFSAYVMTTEMHVDPHHPAELTMSLRMCGEIATIV